MPKKLLAEFDNVVVEKNFPGGRAEAIRDLMHKAIREYELPKQEESSMGGVKA